MLTGEIRSQIDRIWDTFWSGGISNPLEVIEQITYLLISSTINVAADFVCGMFRHSENLPVACTPFGEIQA